jgi:hypothetical protein
MTGAVRIFAQNNVPKPDRTRSGVLGCTPGCRLKSPPRWMGTPASRRHTFERAGFMATLFGGSDTGEPLWAGPARQARKRMRGLHVYRHFRGC